MKPDVIDNLRRQGKKGQRMIAILGESEELARVFSTEIGKYLLEDAIENMDRLLVKIINEDADEKDRAEYRAYKGIIDRWSARVDAYIKQLNKE